MHHLLSVAVAASTLAAATPGTGAVATSAPVTVSTCTVSDLYNAAIAPELGTPISIRSLQLTFRNTDDTVATQVAFDVVHGGEHTTVIDRGRFSKNVAIEHFFADEMAC